MTRVVVDTNVLVSSFFGGRPREVIDCWRRGEITLCVSRALIDEYVDVLNRLRLDADLIRELIDLFASGYHLVYAASPTPLHVLNSDDDMLFQCAVSLKAKVIVTGDKAVRNVGRYMDIDAMTPTEFLARDVK